MRRTKRILNVNANPPRFGPNCTALSLGRISLRRDYYKIARICTMDHFFFISCLRFI